MAGIQSSIGLITGVPIQDTVDNLMKIQARPRDLLLSRTKTLNSEQSAITELTARLLSFQFNVKKFSTADIFQQKAVTSSSNLLGATVTGNPLAGVYQYTPVKPATTQQLISTSFASDSTPIGAGTFAMQYGGALDKGVSLSLLNGGQGIERGKIKVTDRSGASAEVDLRFAVTVDDVLAAFDDASGVNVELEVRGDRFVLVDNTGQTTSNLKVQEVGSGTTAASLGLGGIDAAASEATGSDVIRLYDQLLLSDLNDARGVRRQVALPDLVVTFRDGSDNLVLDFNTLAKSAGVSSGTRIAANGSAAQLRFTAKKTGAEYDGYTISYINNDNVTAGDEVVVYDQEAKTLVFHIDEGNTTADDIIAALAASADASPDFVATRVGGSTLATATLNAASGATGDLTFTAKTGGTSFAGYTVSFVDDPGVTAGNETVTYDTNAKTIVFHIDEGVTTAADIAAAAAADAGLSAHFTVTLPDNFAAATTNAANGVDAQIEFSALASGADLNDVEIVFEENLGVTQGNETVVYDDTPGAKRLVFQIAAGATTATDIVNALANDPQASQVFAATVASGGTGLGLIDTADTATTAGGGNAGLIASSDTTTTTGGEAGLIAITDGVLTSGGAAVVKKNELTLSDLLNTINQFGAGRLRAELRPDGDGLQLVDLTEDLGGAFSATSDFNSLALQDLGLTGAAVNGVIVGERLHSGLKSTLISSLNGGQGLDLGALELTDRAGVSVSLDLSGVETVDALLRAINDATSAAGVAITASIGKSRTGLTLTDTSGSTASPLIVASGDASATAEKLGLVHNAHTDRVVGGGLHKQSVTEFTRLAALNGGGGVSQGAFVITSSAGANATITLSSKITTVGELIKEINTRAVGVTARINDAGDGIALIDTAAGAGTLMVRELAGGRAATDLRLAGDAKTVDIDGVATKLIEGGNRFEITLDDDDTLTDLIEKINTSGAGLTALKLGDGSSGNPFRLTLFGARAGDDANLLFDASGVNFSFNETNRAQDAVLLLGSANTAGAGILSTSKTNRFVDILPGVTLEVRGSSTSQVAIEVKSTDEKLVAAAAEFVKTYNELRTKLDEMTIYDEASGTVGVLKGSVEALRIDTELSRLLTGRFFGVGGVQSLEAVGIRINDTGKLTLDDAKLKAAFAANPTDVTEFFNNKELGVAAKLDKVLEQLAGRNNSLLVSRGQALTARIETNNERVATLNERLEKQRERLLLDFYRMEEAIGKIQANQTALDSIQFIGPDTGK